LDETELIEGGRYRSSPAKGGKREKKRGLSASGGREGKGGKVKRVPGGTKGKKGIFAEEKESFWIVKKRKKTNDALLSEGDEKKGEKNSSEAM